MNQTYGMKIFPVSFLRKRLIFFLAALLPGLHALRAQEPPVEIGWLSGSAPDLPCGVSWGVPWPEGKVREGQGFMLRSAGGQQLPLQSWTMAYWPDGSVKWTGLATVVDSLSGEKLSLSLAGTDSQQVQQRAGIKKNTREGPRTRPVPEKKIRVQETAEAIRVHTGVLKCMIPRSGKAILDSLRVGDRIVGLQGRLVNILQHQAGGEVLEAPQQHEYLSEVQEVTLERGGPVRAVVRVQGKHRAADGSRAWLPFDVRFYFYAGLGQIRMVHTIIYDGDGRQDFIKGLGLVFRVPMQEELHNRHIRFAGEEQGVWPEPVRPLIGRRVITFEDEPVYERQVDGRRLPGLEEFDGVNRGRIPKLAAWNDYKLTQHGSDGFAIQKRTNDSSAWIHAASGGRASGLVFAGDVSGGLAAGLRNFWESYPAALEVRDAKQDTAELRVWMWSPYADAMDMRHYDTLAYGHGLEESYEDVQPGFSTAHGIARTSELMLFASKEIPSHQALSQQAQALREPPALAATPGYLHSTGVFGIWSLPDRSTPGKQWIEEQLDDAISLYQLEIGQRRWYGFWDYGDVMHAYDSQRHTWRYDIGGYAWANTELMPDMWLWYSFLRTGREDIYRMAEAMTRHTSEVDVYHLGRFAGLGSRHNVRHWGDGAKEVRISQAALKRFYYYLSTDERTGDLMREAALKSGEAIERVDPLRLIMPPSEYPTHARIGPDWLALVGNWMTEWERTGDSRWREKIMAGVKSFAEMPYGFFSGKSGAFAYNNSTHTMHMLEEDALGTAHLTVLMGGPEVAFELGPLLNDTTWNRLWTQYARLYGAPEAEQQTALGKTGRLGDLGPHYARLPAYAAMVEQDPGLAQRAWEAFLEPAYGMKKGPLFKPAPVPGVGTLRPVKEVPGVSTNNTAQWCLNAIQLLEMIGDKITENNDLWKEK